MSARKYHKVESTIWTKGWDNETTLLAFYLLTCDHRSTEGIYRLPMAYAAEDLGWSLRKVNKCLGILIDAGFAEYDTGASVVLIVNALKRQAVNPNQAIAAMKKLRDLPATYLRRRFYVLAQGFAKPLAEAMAEGFGEGLEEWLAEGYGDPHSSSSSSTLKGGSRSGVVGSVPSETGHLRRVS